MRAIDSNRKDFEALSLFTIDELSFIISLWGRYLVK